MHRDISTTTGEKAMFPTSQRLIVGHICYLLHRHRLSEDLLLVGQTCPTYLTAT